MNVSELLNEMSELRAVQGELEDELAHIADLPVRNKFNRMRERIIVDKLAQNLLRQEEIKEELA